MRRLHLAHPGDAHFERRPAPPCPRRAIVGPRRGSRDSGDLFGWNFGLTEGGFGGILLGFATLLLFAFLTLILNAGIPPGAREVGRSSEPLFLGFRAIFGNGVTARLLALLGCAGLLASFHAIIFAYGRQMYSLSRAGYFPAWLSPTHRTRRTPARAAQCPPIATP